MKVRDLEHIEEEPTFQPIKKKKMQVYDAETGKKRPIGWKRKRRKEEE